jgi:hypothetical protein
MVLFDRRGNDILVTEEVVKAAAGNEKSGKEVMMLLFKQRGDGILVTEEVVKAAAGNEWKAKEVMMVLFDRRGNDILVTEEVVKAAAGNENSGKEVMMLLFKQRGDGILVTEEVVKAAATCGQERVLNLINKRHKIENMTTWFNIAHFYNAAKDGQLGTIQRLLREGVDPDVRNTRGVTPLWQAASRGHTAVVEALLGSGAVDVNSRSETGRTPLFWSAVDGHFKVVQLLLNNGANPDYRDKNGSTPSQLRKTEAKPLWRKSSLTILPKSMDASLSTS